MFGIIKTWKDYKHEAESYKVRYDLRVQMTDRIEEELKAVKKENEAIKKENETMRRIICTISDEKLSKIKG